VKAEGGWVWCAGGKHPVAKDYISIGPDTQVSRALYRWMEDGYSRVGDVPVQHSWRFFTKGLKPGELACGLVRDSRDGAGRPFPFIVTGYGHVEKWEQHWELIPYALDSLWERMETMSVKRFFDLDDLKSAVSRLPQPLVDGEQPYPANESGQAGQITQSSDVVCLALGGLEDGKSETVQGLKLVKERYPSVPSAVFIGGTQDKGMLMAFMRSLTVSDFEKLWTTC